VGSAGGATAPGSLVKIPAFQVDEQPYFGTEGQDGETPQETIARRLRDECGPGDCPTIVLVRTNRPGDVQCQILRFPPAGREVARDAEIEIEVGSPCEGKEPAPGSSEEEAGGSAPSGPGQEQEQQDDEQGTVPGAGGEGG
jgi:hypothetical protein